MSKRAVFLLVGGFLFFMALHIPANAGDIMSWAPRTFAGGALPGSDGPLLNYAVAIEHGSEAVSGYYSYYNYAPYMTNDGWYNSIYYQDDEKPESGGEVKE